MSKVKLPQVIPFTDVSFKIVDHFFQGLSFDSPSNVPDIFYCLRENESPRSKRSIGAFKNHGKAVLQAFVEAFHELPDEFILGIDHYWWKGNG